MFYHTFVNTAAEAALEAAAPVNELHVGTHVGFASVAANGPRLAMAHHKQRRLHREANRDIPVKCQQYYIYHAGPCHSMTAKQNTQPSYTQSIRLV